jgi:pimeloyl-ACP methyl ester carboxylesterase
MKYVALLGMLCFALACGGASDKPAPETAEPAVLVAGPGTVAAPDGVEIAYTVSGDGSPTLVFIHGWMCDQTFWSAQVEEFSTINTVITIDLPGHGLSGMDREGWPLLAYGADVQAVVEHFGLANVVLIGHSMGGPIALETTRLMPGRVAAVIGVDALHNADVKYPTEQKKARLAAFENDFVGTCRQMSTSMFSEGADPVLVERVSGEMCDGSPEVGTTLIGEFLDYELGPALQAVSDVPVIYINADNYPTDSEANQKYHPTFSGMVVPDVGHFLMMETPEEFNRLLRQIIADLGQSVD